MIQDLVPKGLIADPCVITSECEVIHGFMDMDGHASLAMTFVTRVCSTFYSRSPRSS